MAEVLTRFEDGRLNILVEGGERFQLDELTEGRSFQTGRVLPVDDDEDAPDAVAIEEALRMFGVLRDLTGSEVELPDPGLPQLSFALAGKVELPHDDKLVLLRELSERRRIELVQELLEHAVLTAQRVGERRSVHRRTVASTSGEASGRGTMAPWP